MTYTGLHRYKGVASQPEPYPLWQPTMVGNNRIWLWRRFWGTLSAQQPWSLTFPNADTAQFVVEKDDTAHQGANGYRDHGSNRSEMALCVDPSRDEYSKELLIPHGTPFRISYQMLFMAGPVNTAPWFCCGQFHQDMDANNAPWGPMFNFGLTPGDLLTVDSKMDGPNGQPISLRQYRGYAPLQRQRKYGVQIFACTDPTGEKGRLLIRLDGTTIVNFVGRLGYASATSGLWRHGVYRAVAAEPAGMQYSSFELATGVTIPPVKGA